MADETCKSIPGQYAGPIIGVVFIVGTFCLLSIVLLGYTEIEWKDIALVIVGALLNQCSVILSKWFTASQSSDRKTEIMAESAKILAQEVEKKAMSCKDRYYGKPCFCIVEEALKAGKLRPAQREWAEALCVRDHASLEEYLRLISKPKPSHWSCIWTDCPVFRRVEALEKCLNQLREAMV